MYVTPIIDQYLTPRHAVPKEWRKEEVQIMSSKGELKVWLGWCFCIQTREPSFLAHADAVEEEGGVQGT